MSPRPVESPLAWQNIWAIAVTFIGTVVGAGFASGQEIFQFFGKYRMSGFWGIGLAVFVLGITSAKIYRIGAVMQPESYRDALDFLMPKPLPAMIDGVLAIFFLILTGVMLAGCGTVFELVNLGYWPGIIVSALALILVLCRGLSGLIMANLVIIPLMFIGSVGVSTYAVHHHCTVHFTRITSPGWLLAALQFSGYNLVLALPVLLSLGKKYRISQLLNIGGWLGSLGLGLMAAFINWAILCHYQHLIKAPMPMMDLAELIDIRVYWIYAMILWGEMFTTLLANTYGLAQRMVTLIRLPIGLWVILITIIGVIIAQIGFVALIARFYPVFGLLCLGVLLRLLWKKLPQTGEIRPRNR